MFHGDADMTINYRNFTEAEKEWTDVLGVASNPTSTTMNVKLGNHQATRQQWLSACGYLVLDGFTSIGGDHGPSDALFLAQYVIPFLGLDKVGAVDPEIAQCGSGGSGGAGGGSGVGGTAGVGGRAGAGGAGSGGAGAAGTGGTTGTAGTSGAGGTAGAGGATGSDAAGREGGTGGAGGAGPSGQGGGVGAANSEAAGGCSCAVGASSQSDVAAIAVLVLGFAAITFARPRRRSRPTTAA
jgi:hypothetical protein